MTETRADNEALSTVLAGAVDEFMAECHAGKRPSVEDYATRFPAVAEQLRQVLPALAIAEPADLAGDQGDDAPGTLGDFHVIREVGRGGMGIVYEAEQISLGRRVALKVLPFAATMDPRQLQRFKNEARSAACLDHPNIVKVHAVGCDRAVHYFAMQFIDGQTLAAVIAAMRGQEAGVTGQESGDRGQKSEVRSQEAGSSAQDGNDATTAHSPRPGAPVEPAAETRSLGRRSTENTRQDAAYFRRVAEWGIQAAEALDHAHGLGIVHRDIKPGNLMIESPLAPLGRGVGGEGRSPTPRLWVTDFGLARTASDSGLTMTGDLVGTLRYMSPEQALAKRVVIDHRTDIYSLGATLYELLTLEPAYGGDDRQELLRQIAFEEPKPPRKLNKSIPAELETIVLKAMEKNPADRYASAQELAGDLERYLKDEPIRARRPTLVQRTRKWSRRHHALVQAGLVALFLISVLSVASALLIGSAYRQEKQAKELAEAREAETNAVLAFVEERIFAAARPEGQEGGLDRDVKLRDAIETAMPFVENSFTDQPLIEARLRTTVGTSFLYLGEGAKAEEQCQRARTLYTQYRGPHHPDTLGSMHHLARSYSLLGRDADACKLHEAVLALRKAKLGPDHPDTLRSMNALAGSYLVLGRYSEAVTLYEETLTLRKVKLGADHPDTLTSITNVALAYQNLGRFADALRLYEETLAIRRAKLGPDHPDTLLTMSGLANSYAAFGRHTDALNLQKETLALQIVKLGADHPTTLGSMNNLANGYRALGQRREAMKLYEETLAIMRVKIPNQRFTFNCMSNLATTYGDLGRHADALKLHEETLTLRKDKLGSDHPDTLGSMHNLARTYHRLGRLGDALTLREETLTLRTAKLGRDHPDTLSSMADLAESYNRLDRKCEALKLLEEVLSLRQAKLGEDYTDTLISMQNLGISYLNLDRPAEAAKLFEKKLALEQAKYGPDRSLTLVSTHHLAMAYNACGRRADAVKLYEEALGRGVKTPNRPFVEDLMFGLARTYVHMDRWAEALKVFEEGVTISKAIKGANHPSTRSWMKRLEACQRGYQLEIELRAVLADKALVRETSLSGTLTTKEREKQVHEVKLLASATYVIEMESTRFNALLRLEDARKNKLEENDDIVEGIVRNSRLIFEPMADGVYRLVASGCEDTGTGAYTLRIREFRAETGDQKK